MILMLAFAELHLLAPRPSHQTLLQFLLKGSPLGDKVCTVGDTVHRAGHQRQQNTNVHWSAGDVTFQSPEQHLPSLQTYYNQCAITIKAFEPSLRGVRINNHVHLKQRLPLSSAISSEPASFGSVQSLRGSTLCSSVGDKRQENLFLDTSERRAGVN